MGDEPAACAGLGAGTAFETALRGSARPTLQFAAFVLDALTAAEDTLQDAFVIAWRRRKRLEDEADFRATLLRIVLRECLRWRRHPIFRFFALKDRVMARADQDATTQR